MAILKQNTSYTRTFLMLNTSSPPTGLAGLTVGNFTIKISKNGGALTPIFAPSVTDLGGGYYKYTASTSDTDTLGDLAWACSNSGCSYIAYFTDQVTDGLPVDAVKLNGALLSGNNAVLRLKALDIQNADTGVTGGAQGTVGHAVYIVSHGYDGINIAAPNNGISAASTNANGMTLSGHTGLNIVGNTLYGVNVQGSNAGIQVVGYPGPGVSITGWTDGMYIEGGNNGMNLEGGATTGSGLRCFGGNGILAAGWTSPGHGINCTPAGSGLPINGTVVLSSNGLDNISTTAPSGPATNFRQMMVQVWRRFFKKTTLDASNIKTYADDNTTVITTQTASETGGVQTQGPAT